MNVAATSTASASGPDPGGDGVRSRVASVVCDVGSGSEPSAPVWSCSGRAVRSHCILGCVLSSVLRIFKTKRWPRGEFKMPRTLGTWQISVPMPRLNGNFLKTLEAAIRSRMGTLFVFVLCGQLEVKVDMSQDHEIGLWRRVCAYISAYNGVYSREPFFQL